MNARIICLIWIISTLFMGFPVDSARAAYDPSFLVSDSELTDTYSMSKDQLSSFLSRGSLASYRTKDVDGVKRSAADIIWNTAQQFDINPQFLLVLLQREQSLVEDDDPTDGQLDWAMGYAICDDCDKNDPQLQKYRGFGNQLYYAAKKIRNDYLHDLDDHGTTISGVGPGIATQIDGVTVIPANFATAILYTYTPHLHGNENFVSIWRRWFTHDYPTGSLLQNSVDGGVWLVQYGKRRPITSRTAFLTRFNPDNLVQVKPSELAAYEIGLPISFPNYSLLRSPRGTVYLIVDDTRRGFDSREALRSVGINSDEIIDVSFDDLAAYTEGDPITADSSNPLGELIQDPKTGGIFYVEDGIKHGIMSREIMKNRFPNWKVTPGDLTALALMPSGDAVTFSDGTLVKVAESPDVFVISDGLRRPIVNGETFEAYGWKWDKIVMTNERSVLLSPLGDLVTNEKSDSETQLLTASN